MNAMDASTGAATAVPALLLVLALYVWTALALGAVFAKSGEQRWKAWVPVLNEVVLFRLGGLSGWLVLLWLLPIAGWIARIVAAHRIGAAFRFGAGMTVLAALLFPVWASILGFGSATWVGREHGPRRTGAVRTVEEGPVAASVADDRDARSAAPPRSDPRTHALPDVIPVRYSPAPSTSTAAPATDGWQGLAFAEFTDDVTAGVVDAPAPLSARRSADAGADAGAEPSLESAPDAAPRAASLPVTSEPPAAPPVPDPGPAVRPSAAMPPPADLEFVPPPDPHPAAPIVRAPLAPAADAPAPSAAAPITSVPALFTAPPAPLAPREADPEVREPWAPRDPEADAFAEESGPLSAGVAPPESGAPRSALASVSAQDRQPQIPEPPIDETVIARRRRTDWVLVPPTGAPVPIVSDVVLLGRRPAADPDHPGAQLVAIDDGTVSKTHARLDLRGQVWFITDLDSTNGIVFATVLGTEVEATPGVEIEAGDRFLLGDAEVRITRSDR